MTSLLNSFITRFHHKNNSSGPENRILLLNQRPLSKIVSLQNRHYRLNTENNV